MSNGRTYHFYDWFFKRVVNLKDPLPGNWSSLGLQIKWPMYIDYYQNQYRLMAHDVDNQNYHIAAYSTRKQVLAGFYGNESKVIDNTVRIFVYGNTNISSGLSSGAFVVFKGVSTNLKTNKNLECYLHYKIIFVFLSLRFSGVSNY